MEHFPSPRKKAPRRILSWLAFSFLAGSSLPGQAVTPVKEIPGVGAPQQLEAYLVTGSYLPSSAAVTASPVQVIDHSRIGQSGATDTLRLLKSVAPVFTGNLNTGNEWVSGGSGDSFAGLRNITTLVLVDGRRFVNSPYSSSTQMFVPPNVDLNTIPLSMIERVEILKDSASTLYGSDAIGGVINIILRKDYTGAEFGTRFGTDDGRDYQTREGWFTAGVATRTGSITVGAQYFENEALTSLNRKLSFLSPEELTALGQNPGVLPSYFNASYAGRNGNDIIAGSPLAVGAPGYNPNIRTLPAKTDPNAPPLTMDQLRTMGYYIRISDTPLSRAAGGLTQILNTSLYDAALVLPARRAQFIVTGEKELAGPGLRFFGEMLYSQNTYLASDLSPTPITGISAWNLTIPANNPYNLFGVPIGVNGAANAPGVRSRLDELGNRSVEAFTDTYRVVLGLRGQLGERWNWEAAGNYARAAGEQTYFGAGDGYAMNEALTPLLSSAGGYVYDAEGRPLSIHVDPKTGRNVPVYDLFGIAGSNAPASIEAVRQQLFRTSRVEHRSFDLRVTGRPLTLPAGDLAVAVGAEVRRERISSQSDRYLDSGFALGFVQVVSLPRVERRMRAGFIETNVPLTSARQEVPLLHRLDVTAAVRYERISPGGNALSPKFGARLLPFDEQLVLRGTFSRGFIAPTLFALYGPPASTAPNVAILEGNGQTGSGGATGRMVTGQFVPVASELSNPQLEAAKSESFTAGVVYSPKRIKGLTFSADYYHIRHGKVGGTDHTFIAADLNARGAASIYAPNFRFTDGSSLTSNAPNQVTSTNYGRISVMVNPIGDLWTDGLDLGTAYEFGGPAGGTLRVGVDANVPFNFKARTSPISPYYQYARNFTDFTIGKGNQQGVIPNYALKGHVHYTRRDLSVRLQVSHLPKLNAPGTAFGAPPGTVNLQRLDGKAYTIASYTTADLSVSYPLPALGRRALDRITLTAGVNNVFDRDPPFVPGGGGGGGTESNTAKYAYDIVGRFFFLELKKTF